jgi:hypothetical protein
MRSILHTLERLLRKPFNLNIYSRKRIIFRSIKD